MNFIKLLTLSFFLLPSFVLANSVVYTFPTYDDIDQTNPPEKSGDAPDPSDRISFDGEDQLITAFTFCNQLGYSYVSHLADSTTNPSAVYEPPEDEWEQKGNKDTFLSITCDDGVVSSSSDITVDVTIPNFPDYTEFHKWYFIILSSVFFLFIIWYIKCIVRKFL